MKLRLLNREVKSLASFAGSVPTRSPNFQCNADLKTLKSRTSLLTTASTRNSMNIAEKRRTEKLQKLVAYGLMALPVVISVLAVAVGDSNTPVVGLDDDRRDASWPGIHE